MNPNTPVDFYGIAVPAGIVLGAISGGFAGARSESSNEATVWFVVGMVVAGLSLYGMSLESAALPFGTDIGVVGGVVGAISVWVGYAVRRGTGS
jgi:hypothetical protein